MRGKTHIDKAITGGLRANQRTTPAETLSCQHTLPLVSLSLVSTEQETDLATTDTNITSRNVNISTDVLAQFHHKSTAEFANFIVGFALRVEVCTTFTTAHVHFVLSSAQFSGKDYLVSLTYSQ